MSNEKKEGVSAKMMHPDGSPVICDKCSKGSYQLVGEVSPEMLFDPSGIKFACDQCGDDPQIKLGKMLGFGKFPEGTDPKDYDREMLKQINDPWNGKKPAGGFSN